MKTTYDIISLDVWGNPKDGWEVNQSFMTDRTITVNYPDEPKPDENGRVFEGAWGMHSRACDRAIVRALKRAGEIKHGIRVKSIGIDTSSETTIYIADNRRPSYSKNYGWGKPVIELRVKECQ